MNMWRQLFNIDPGVESGGYGTGGLGVGYAPSPSGRLNSYDLLMRAIAPQGVDLVAPSGAFAMGFIGSDPTMRWKKFFNPTTTDLPMYDNMIENAGYHATKKGRNISMEMMTPSDYFQRLTELEGRGTTVEREKRSTMPTTVNRYVADAQAGAKFPIPVLDKMYNEQEGRHRMLMAEQLGVKEVPVLVVDRLKELLGIK